MGVTIYVGDCRETLAKLPAGSVQCVITSPPYWGLRDYGVAGQLGLERRPDCLGWATGEPCGECYVCHLVAVFREVWRVLRSDGTVWLNLGDSYASGKGSCFNPGGGESSYKDYRKEAGVIPLQRLNVSEVRDAGLKPKDLVGIPWRVALALQADGWWLRSDVVWSKLNPLPESVTDRPVKGHEYVFLLAKSRKYYYDHEAVKEPVTKSSIARVSQATFDQQTGGEKDYGRNGTNTNRSMRRTLENFAASVPKSATFRREASKREAVIPGQTVGTHRPDREDTIPTGMRNRRSVWMLATRPFKGAHFAVFPEALVEPCLLAGTPAGGCCARCGAPNERVIGDRETVDGRGSGNVERKVKTTGERSRVNTHLGSSVPWKPTRTATTGWRPTCGCGVEETRPAVVLDPFGGSGTVAVVADRFDREAILIELNPEYAALAEIRIRDAAPLLANVEAR